MSKRKKPEVSVKNHTRCVTHSLPKRNYRIQCHVFPNNTPDFKDWCTIDTAEASKRYLSSLTDSLLAEFTAIDHSQIKSIPKSFTKYTGEDIDSRRANIDVILWTCYMCKGVFRVSWTGRKNKGKTYFHSSSIIEHIKKCISHHRKEASHDPPVPALPVTAFEHSFECSTPPSSPPHIPVCNVSFPAFKRRPPYDTANVYATTAYTPSHITKFTEWVDAHQSSTSLQHAISIHKSFPVINMPENDPLRKIYVCLASRPNPPFIINPPAPKMPVVRRCLQTPGDAVSTDQHNRQDVVPLLLACNEFSLYQQVCVDEQLVVGLDTIINTDTFDKYMYFADTIASTDAFFQFYCNSYYRTNTSRIGYGITSSVYEVRRRCDDSTPYAVKLFTGDFNLFHIVREVVSLLTFRYIWFMYIHYANYRIYHLYIYMYCCHMCSLLLRLQ